MDKEDALERIEELEDKIQELEDQVQEAYEIFRDWDDERYDIRRHRVACFMKSVPQPEN